MMFNNSYATIMASQPTVFQNTTLATVAAVAGPVGSGFQLYSNVSNLSGSWTGSAQQAQGSQASTLVGKGQQVVTAMTQTQQIINAGAQQLTNAKARLVALTKAATTEGFAVLPVGKVVLGPAQLAKIAALHASNQHAAAEALRAQLLARAGSYNAQLDLVVLQTNAADAQVALTLANSAVSVLGALTQNNSSTAATPQVTTATAPPPTVAAPGALTPGALTPATPIVGGTPGPNGTTGTALAGAGPLGGAGTTPLGLTGAGAAPLQGTAGLNPSVLGGTAGLGPGMVGTGRGALAGEVTAGRGAAGPGSGMLYGGAGMAGGELREEEDREGSDWLAEDGDPWRTDDAVNDVGGVLS